MPESDKRAALQQPHHPSASKLAELANSVAEERAAEGARDRARKEAKEAERTSSLAQRRYDTAKKRTDDVRLGKA